MLQVKVLDSQRSAIIRKFAIHQRALVFKNGDAAKSKFFVLKEKELPKQKPKNLPGTFPYQFIWQVLCGKDVVDLSSLVEKKEDGWYRTQDEFWCSYKGKSLPDSFKLCGNLFHVEEGKIEHVRPIILEEDEEYNDGGHHIFIDLPNGLGIKPEGGMVTYGNSRASFPIEVSTAYLEGKRRIDIGFLFNIKDGELYRSDNIFWAQSQFSERSTDHRNTKVTKESSVCFNKISKRSIMRPTSLFVTLPQGILELVKKRGKLIKDTYYLEKDDVGSALSLDTVKAILNNDPVNLDHLFDVVEGYRVRNQHPIWGELKGAASNVYNISFFSVPKDATKPAERNWPKSIPDKAVKHLGIIYTNKFLRFKSPIWVSGAAEIFGITDKLFLIPKELQYIKIPSDFILINDELILTSELKTRAKSYKEIDL